MAWRREISQRRNVRTSFDGGGYAPVCKKLSGTPVNKPSDGAARAETRKTYAMAANSGPLEVKLASVDRTFDPCMRVG